MAAHAVLYYYHYYYSTLPLLQCHPTTSTILSVCMRVYQDFTIFRKKNNAHLPLLHCTAYAFVSGKATQTQSTQLVSMARIK
jgi:hypothetical protein